jgi:TonB family protein
LSLKELTNISHLLINRNRFKSFLLLSTLIHLSIIIALPLSVNKKPLAKPKSFKVEFIRKNPQFLKKQPKKHKNIIKEEAKSKRLKNPPANKKPAKENITLQKEATISLDARDVKYTSYLSHLRQKINDAWIYPEFAKNKKLEGEITLCFTLKSDGSLLDVIIISPSGQAVLDQASISAIDNAGPFNPLPEKLNLSKLNVISTFIYQFEADY